MLFDVSPSELIVILLVALIVFGPKRLPEMARKISGWVREIQSTAGTLQRSLEQEVGTIKDPIRQLGEDVKSIDSPEKRDAARPDDGPAASDPEDHGSEA